MCLMNCRFLACVKKQGVLHVCILVSGNCGNSLEESTLFNKGMPDVGEGASRHPLGFFINFMA